MKKYRETYGNRKCESNAIVPFPAEARHLMESAIEKYLGPDARDRFQEKRNILKEEMDGFRTESGIKDHIKESIKILEEY